MRNECREEVLRELGISVEKTRSRRRGFSLLDGLILGSLAGAGLALLMAPGPGMQTRDMLREKSLDLRDMAQSKVEETRERAQQVVRTAADRANELAQRGTTVVSQQKANLQGLAVGVREGLNTYKELNIQSNSGAALAETVETGLLAQEDEVHPSGEATSP
jgi:gas vesicle protein